MEKKDSEMRIEPLADEKLDKVAGGKGNDRDYGDKKSSYTFHEIFDLYCPDNWDGREKHILFQINRNPLEEYECSICHVHFRQANEDDENTYIRV